MTSACSLLEELAHINSVGFADCVPVAVTRLSRVRRYSLSVVLVYRIIEPPYFPLSHSELLLIFPFRLYSFHISPCHSRLSSSPPISLLNFLFLSSIETVLACGLCSDLDPFSLNCRKIYCFLPYLVPLSRSRLSSFPLHIAPTWRISPLVARSTFKS